jgi:hypothetical protein
VHTTVEQIQIDVTPPPNYFAVVSSLDGSLEKQFEIQP